MHLGTGKWKNERENFEEDSGKVKFVLNNRQLNNITNAFCNLWKTKGEIFRAPLIITL